MSNSNFFYTADKQGVGYVYTWNIEGSPGAVGCRIQKHNSIIDAVLFLKSKGITSILYENQNAIITSLVETLSKMKNKNKNNKRLSHSTEGGRNTTYHDNNQQITHHGNNQQNTYQGNNQQNIPHVREPSVAYINKKQFFDSAKTVDIYLDGSYRNNITTNGAPDMCIGLNIPQQKYYEYTATRSEVVDSVLLGNYDIKVEINKSQNVAELFAIIRAVDSMCNKGGISSDSLLRVHSDSTYAIGYAKGESIVKSNAPNSELLALLSKYVYPHNSRVFYQYTPKTHPEAKKADELSKRYTTEENVVNYTTEEKTFN